MKSKLLLAVTAALTIGSTSLLAGPGPQFQTSPRKGRPMVMPVAEMKCETMSIKAGGKDAGFRAGTPDVAADFDQAAACADGFHDEGGFTDQPFDVAALFRRSFVEVFQRDGPDETDHEQGHYAERDNLEPEVRAGKVGN